MLRDAHFPTRIQAKAIDQDQEMYPSWHCQSESQRNRGVSEKPESECRQSVAKMSPRKSTNVERKASRCWKWTFNLDVDDEAVFVPRLPFCANPQLRIHDSILRSMSRLYGERWEGGGEFDVNYRVSQNSFSKSESPIPTSIDFLSFTQISMLPETYLGAKK